jgi:hypothetical protein
MLVNCDVQPHFQREYSRNKGVSNQKQKLKCRYKQTKYNTNVLDKQVESLEQQKTKIYQLGLLSVKQLWFLDTF